MDAKLQIQKRKHLLFIRQVQKNRL
jgi:hypothetical protein